MKIRGLGQLVGALCLLYPILGFADIEEKESHYKYLASKYYVNADGSYTSDHRLQVAIESESRVKQWRNYSIVYYPNAEKVFIDEAYVIRPDGKKIDVKLSDIVTSEISQKSSGKSSSEMDVYFPQLQPHSLLFLHYHKESHEPSIFGFNLAVYPDVDMFMQKHEIMIEAPSEIPLQWTAFGNYKVDIRSYNKKQVIHAVARNVESIKLEPNMVSPYDVSSHFLVSSLKKWEQVGDIYWQYTKPKVIVNNEIKKLAANIVGDKKGLDKIFALNNWVASKIQYHGLSFDLKSNFIPHSSVEVLENGYGDCKDKVTLLQALATAQGIKSLPVLVDWGKSFKAMSVPHPYQFNHLMIYFPDYRLYANPTDENSTVGLLDFQLANKLVVIAADHSKLAKTPMNHAQNNHYVLHNNITFDDRGGLKADSRALIEGGFYIDMMTIFENYGSGTDFANDFLALTPEGGNGVAKVLPSLRLQQKSFNVNSHWNSSNVYAMDKVIVLPVPQGIDILNPGLIKYYVSEPKINYPMLCRAQNDTWQYELAIPKGYKVMHMPKNIDFKSSEGAYLSNYQYKGNRVLIKRKLTVNNDMHQPQQYPEFRKIFTTALLDFRSQLVLQKS